ncbi:MAG: pyridoxamine 5'-phosphate oxidase family protein [Candidatus Limnocylindrales bacterium]
MASWSEVEAAAPELAAAVKRYFDAHVHKTIATLRADGSPRISGTETQFRDGELWIGSMPHSRKTTDLQRDPRFALHSGSDEPSAWSGDAKISGRMAEITDAALVADINGTEVGPSHLFRAEIERISTVSLNDKRDKLIIESWRPGREVERVERE